MKQKAKNVARVWWLLVLAVIALPGLVAAADKATDPDNALVDRGNGVIEEKGTGRMWQQERSRSFKTLEQAEAYVKTLTLDGYTDWRLPTVYELYDLHYLVDVKKAEGIDLRMEGNYWVIDKEGTGMAGSWEVGDQCEPTRTYFKKTWGYVRAVRP